MDNAPPLLKGGWPHLPTLSGLGISLDRVAANWEPNRPQRGPYTGRGKRAHGAMNKEHHVCARRRAGEAAGPVGLVDDRTRES
ncbi:MAG TPA: hypothetical protein VEM37_03235 [Nitrospiraceae bacterium]|nr:hypothetical protein [Nitrospiraceae bacterium]